MKSIEFPQSNVKIGEGQPQYQTLHAHVDPNDPAQTMTMCFELSKEEIAQIVLTGKIWMSQLTFGMPFQPIRMSVDNPFQLIEQAENPQP